MENHGLVVLEARYGTPGRAKSKAKANGAGPTRHETGAMIDVTIPVAGLVHQGQLAIARGVNKVSYHQIAPYAVHSC
jgi:hypothetical protein